MRQRGSANAATQPAQRSLFIAALLLLVGLAYGQTAPPIANVSARHGTSLNGDWRVIVDPYDVGALDYRDRPLKNKNAFYKNYKPQSPSDLIESDFDTSETLSVPSD